MQRRSQGCHMNCVAARGSSRIFRSQLQPPVLGWRDPIGTLQVQGRLVPPRLSSDAAFSPPTVLTASTRGRSFHSTCLFSLYIYTHADPILYLDVFYREAAPNSFFWADLTPCAASSESDPTHDRNLLTHPPPAPNPPPDSNGCHPYPRSEPLSLPPPWIAIGGTRSHLPSCGRRGLACRRL
jgi:hypothetical protein